MLPVLASPCSCVGSRDPRPRTLLLAAGKRCSRHSPRYHGRLRRRPFRHPTSNAGNSCGYCVHHPRTPASRAAAAADRTRVLRAAACAGAQPSDWPRDRGSTAADFCRRQLPPLPCSRIGPAPPPPRRARPPASLACGCTRHGYDEECFACTHQVFFTVRGQSPVQNKFCLFKIFDSHEPAAPSW